MHGSRPSGGSLWDEGNRTGEDVMKKVIDTIATVYAEAMIVNAARALYECETPAVSGSLPTYEEFVAKHGPLADVWRLRAEVALRAALGRKGE